MLDGIQKRLERLADLAALRRRLRVALSPLPGLTDSTSDLERRLTVTRKHIGRLVEALAEGHQDLPSVRGALEGLERERAALEERLAEARRQGSRVPEQLDDVIEGVIGTLANVRTVLEAGKPEERRTVVRLFLRSIRVEAANRRVVFQWYRLPQDSFVKLVAVGGIEPPTRGL